MVIQGQISFSTTVTDAAAVVAWVNLPHHLFIHCLPAKKIPRRCGGFYFSE
jgi:hypothetical protein